MTKREQGKLSREELRERLAALEAQLEALYELEPEGEDEDHEDWEDALDDLRDEQDELTDLLRR